MKAASVQEIKQQLKELNKQELANICLRLVRYKKENKELVTYLLFEEQDQDAFIMEIKKEIDEGFSDMNTNNLFFAKKTLRKLLRIINKYIRFSGTKTVEVEIRMHYLTNFKGLRLPWQKAPVMVNLYKGQIKKIRAAIDTMHEDLQYDYQRAVERLEI